MAKNSTLYQLMSMRINGVMNGITEQDEDYQALLRTVDKYSGRLEALHLPVETMKLIDRYVSEYNAIGSRYGMLAYTTERVSADKMVCFKLDDGGCDHIQKFLDMHIPRCPSRDISCFIQINSSNQIWR